MRQRNDIVGFRGKADAFHHGRAVLLAQMTIALHREGSPVAVTEPAGHGWSIHAFLDAGGREIMPEIIPVLGDLFKIQVGIVANSECADFPLEIA